MYFFTTAFVITVNLYYRNFFAVIFSATVYLITINFHFFKLLQLKIFAAVNVFTNVYFYTITFKKFLYWA